MADDGLPPQTPEELAAQYADTGPVSAAQRWLEAAQAGDFATLWSSMDDTLRLAVAQDWIYSNRRNARDFPRHAWDTIAQQLSETPPRHETFADDFSTIMLTKFQQIPYDPDTWGAASRPRPIGVDCELVLFIDTKGEVITFDEPTLVDTELMLMMRSTADGWKVAALTDQMPRPGWPPDAGLGPRDEL